MFGLLGGMDDDAKMCKRCGGVGSSGLYPTADIELSSDGFDEHGIEAVEAGSTTYHLCPQCTRDLNDFLTQKRDRFLSKPLAELKEKYEQCDHARHSMIAEMLDIVEERRGPVTHTEFMKLLDEYQDDFETETDTDGEAFAPDDSTGIMDMFDGEIDDMFGADEGGMNAEQVETDETDDTNAGNGMAVPERDDEDEAKHGSLRQISGPGQTKLNPQASKETVYHRGNVIFTVPDSMLEKTDIKDGEDGGRPPSDELGKHTKLFKFCEWFARQNPDEYVTARGIADETHLSHRQARDRLWAGGGAYAKGLVNRRKADGKRDRYEGVLSVEGRRRVNETIESMDEDEKSTFVPLELTDDSETESSE